LGSLVKEVATQLTRLRERGLAENVIQTKGRAVVGRSASEQTGLVG
jgi:hypothetical protein